MGIDIVIEDERWAGSGLDAVAERAVAATLAHFGLPSCLEIVLLACNDAKIADLNADFRGKPVATNILSWPSTERGSAAPGVAPGIAPDLADLGDLAIAYETCLAEADTAGIELGDHVTHLLVHGILHLLGYDHENDADGDLMESVETAILAELGIADPYGTSAPGNLIDGKD